MAACDVGVAWPGCVVSIAEKWRLVSRLAIAWLVHFTWLGTRRGAHELELFPIDRTIAVLIHLPGHRVRVEGCGVWVGLG